MKSLILASLGYTPLVYSRINKKLAINLSKKEIETFIYSAISAPHATIEKKGKNFYIYNIEVSVRITVNSTTYRVITVDRL
ncbi:DUF3781 domain-containing protein [Enterococcus mundtii]|uniref:DUF3781 domain-containing protein n=1 Tax=Enterococcus mundtii TaxID=53346 RepID=A0A2S7RU17_ENTMU|nr:DUF3781 domain-containing protein [Enterococcus mundtii]PQF23171.1 hypothetical protein CUS89_08210 [Enterococcus mundtii]PTO40564.1 DUF3781 domain-containing protein [Enterococcus mundtii]PTO43853.1 DUF3781 domain-containing protein [Enterococcus mundtii]